MASIDPLSKHFDSVRESLRSKDGLSAEEIFSVLSHRRRRYTLYYLLQNGRDTDIRKISEQVAVWESDSAAEAESLNSTERKRVYTALQQNHLPSMDDIGVVDYDKNRGKVEPTEKIKELDIYLDIVQSGQVPWGIMYLALSVGSLILLLVVGIVGFPLTLLPPLAWGLVVVIMFTITSLAHLYENRQQKFRALDAPPELDNSRD